MNDIYDNAENVSQSHNEQLSVPNELLRNIFGKGEELLDRRVKRVIYAIITHGTELLVFAYLLFIAIDVSDLRHNALCETSEQSTVSALFVLYLIAASTQIVRICTTLQFKHGFVHADAFCKIKEFDISKCVLHAFNIFASATLTMAAICRCFAVPLQLNVHYATAIVFAIFVLAPLVCVDVLNMLNSKALYDKEIKQKISELESKRRLEHKLLQKHTS